jgi:CelD/BcsL family acetyltransferase involved in cellulose biosynthesis
MPKGLTRTGSRRLSCIAVGEAPMHSPASPSTRSVESLYVPPSSTILRPPGSAAATITTAIVNPRALLDNDYARVDALASKGPVCALFDARWIASWLAAFDLHDPLFLCAYEDRDIAGLAALKRLSEVWHGYRLRIVQSLTNVETYRFDFLSDGRVDVVEQLWRALCVSGLADVIRLENIPDGSPTLAAGLTVAKQEGWRAVLEPTFLTPRRTLTAPWDHELSAKFKANLRHRERRLARRGAITFDLASGERGASRAIEAFYRIESSGWKGQRGTAVAHQPRVKRLYDGMIAGAGADVLIPVLSVSNTPVAAQVLRMRGRTMFMLKTAYDEAYSECAPGQLITARILQYGVQHGTTALDFLADNAPWKAEWATEFLRHHRISLFAPTLAGRYAYWARYGIRDQVKRVPGAVRMVRWMRGQP